VSKPPVSVQTDPKILALEELATTVREHRAAGRVVVHCHGVFDLVHPGHVQHLRSARALGDVLVVTITPDRLVNKGPGRPVFNERLRAESLAAFELVSHVAVNEWPTAVETIRLLQPDVYVKGGEYERREDDLTGMILEEERAVAESGGRIEFTHDVTFSSTQLLNAHFGVFPPEVNDFLAGFRARHGADEIVDLLKSLQELTVVVVGDAIIDEYHFCRPYGMASKSATIAAQLLHEERHLGGALALANHLAGFCGRVQLVTALGSRDPNEELVRSGLRPNVEPTFVYRDDAPTVTKRRYVNPFLVQKLFEVGIFNDAPLPDGPERELGAAIRELAPAADLTVVADFGNGLIAEPTVAALVASAQYLAVNAQSNAINLGFNVVTKYPRADYVCLDREEALLAVRDRHAPLEAVMDELSTQLGTSAFTITRGPEGAIVRRGDDVAKVPALSQEVVDTIGAGDAFFAITSPLARLGADPDVIGFVGNAVGTLAVRVIGNKEPVEPVPLYKFITTLLK
jgi:rfaE bifunctional protein nucleotidyltransferase chain/domain